MKKVIPDIAVNLTTQLLKYEDIIISNSKSKKVLPIFIGTDYDSSILSLEKSKKYKTFCYIGLHPNSADKYEDLTRLKTLFDDINSKYIIGIGELGLDYNRNFTSKILQKKVFEKQLEYSKNMNLPYFFHCRDAFDDFFEIIDSLNYKIKGVIHSFDSNSLNIAKIIKRDFYIGINGLSCQNIDIINDIPLNRLFVETDSPYCSLKNKSYVTKTFKGAKKSMNEPAKVCMLVETISKIKKVEISEVVENLRKNFFDLFNVDLNKYEDNPENFFNCEN